MATKKANTTKKASARTTAAAKTSARPARTKPTTKTVVKSVTAPKGRFSLKVALPNNLVNIVFAELAATFVLTLAALTAAADIAPLFVGLAVATLVMTVGAVSGAHLNPAVTFGLWSMRKLRTVLVPFYWGAQLLGAMLAVIVINWVSGTTLSLDFNHIWTLDWSVLGFELVGTAVFMFGLAAAVGRTELTAGARALGVGLALIAGLTVGGTLHSAVKTKDIADYQKAAQSETETPEIPHSVYVKGVLLNPAVALAATEHTQSELIATGSTTKEPTYSRFSSEVVLGTLVGAALGGNLYLLLVGRKNNN